MSYIAKEAAVASSDTIPNGAVYVPPFNERERIPQGAIDFLVRQIAEQFHPERIILFGSYAYGTPDPESDVDLLVVMDTPIDVVDQALLIRRATHHPFAFDLLVRTPATLAQRLELGDFFLREITQRGKIVYERIDR
jgi:uncharacterized protein